MRTGEREAWRAMASNTREPLRNVADQNATCASGAAGEGSARPAGATKRHHLRERGTMLQALPDYPDSDPSFLGPASARVPRDSVVRLQLIGCSHGVPKEIVLDRSPLIVGRNARSGADILLDDPEDRHLISQVSCDHPSAPRATLAVLYREASRSCRKLSARQPFRALMFSRCCLFCPGACRLSFDQAIICGLDGRDRRRARKKRVLGDF